MNSIKFPKLLEIQGLAGDVAKFADGGLTQEVLFIKSGKIRVNLYYNDQIYLGSRILYPGDVILLAQGAHGFEMLEASKMIEVKQRSYCGEQDKVRFEPVPKAQVKLLKMS